MLKLLGIAFLVIILLMIFSGNNTSYDNSTSTSQSISVSKEEPPVVPTKESSLRDVAYGCSFGAFEKPTTKTDISFGLAFIDVCIAFIQEAKRFSDEMTDEEKAVITKAKRDVRKRQIKVLPVYRDQYGPVLRKSLWEFDVHAKTHSKGFKTITYTGGVFASNQGIKAIFDGQYATWHKLRFTRAQFKWHKLDDDYTYYTLETPKDSEIKLFNERSLGWEDVDL